jgi:thymidylate synthase ThyX
MTTSVKIIEDSISQHAARLTTFQLSYPRYIHAEVMTHRVFSRNASSSRAIPVAKLATAALADMVKPVRWGLNQPGMQAGEQNLTGEALDKANAVWERMARACAKGSAELAELGLHKQWANRPLEWFSNIEVVLTATDWNNFFELRAHPDAQPEIHLLANLMFDAMDKSNPTVRKYGEWHLPYISQEEREKFKTSDLVRFSAARCARVSYLTHDKKVPSPEKDLQLFEALVGSKPLHASPTEHQGTPDSLWGVEDGVEDWDKPKLGGNFRGWTQFRKLLERDVAGTAKPSK